MVFFAGLDEVGVSTVELGRWSTWLSTTSRVNVTYGFLKNSETPKGSPASTRSLTDASISLGKNAKRPFVRSEGSV